MDADRFDAATRVLSNLASRRAATGLLLSPLLSTLALAGTDAKKHKPKPKKKKCKGGTSKCGKKCVNTKTDASHCGGCNRACRTGIPCVNGACQETDTCDPECPAGRDCFEGACTCQSSGECLGREDPAGEFCVGSTSQPTVTVCGCLDGFKVCRPGERCSNCCSDLECVQANPGAEGIICPTVPDDYSRGRFCCIDVDKPCASPDDCCSLQCDFGGGFPGVCV